MSSTIEKCQIVCQITSIRAEANKNLQLLQSHLTHRLNADQTLKPAVIRSWWPLFDEVGFRVNLRKNKGLGMNEITIKY